MSYLCVFKRFPLGVKICLSHAQIALLYGVTKSSSHAQLVSFRESPPPTPGCQQVPAPYKRLIQDKNELTNELLTDGSY